MDPNPDPNHNPDPNPNPHPYPDPNLNAVIAVFERDEALTPKGASVAISPEGWAALRCIDLTVCKRLRRMAAPIESISILPMEDGGLAAAPGYARVPLRVVGALNRGLRVVGLPRVVLARASRWHDVRTALATRVQEVCGEDTLRLDCRLTSLSEATVGDGFTLTFESGAAVEARVVLACDGTRSSVRELAPRGARGEQVLVDEGKSVWRGIAPGADLKGACTFLRDMKRAPNGALAITRPAGGKEGGTSWAVTAPKVEGYARTSDEARKRLRTVLPQLAKDAPPDAPLAKLLRCIDASPVIIENRLKVRTFGEHSPPFCSALNGVTFLGDAAHPVRPTGEGVTLAFQDAWQLGAIVKASPDLLPNADMLRCYEAASLPRVRHISEKVRAIANAMYKTGSPPPNKKGPPRLRPKPL